MQRQSIGSALKGYSIVQFQPTRIVVIHTCTRRLYTYHQIQPNPQQLTHLSYQITHLVTPTLLYPVVLYPKSMTDLKTVLQSKRLLKNPTFFTSEQLINTFMPIVQCLKSLHKQQLIHRSITTQTIVIDEQGNVKLKDWIVPNVSLSNSYYHKNLEERTTFDDWKSLAYIIIQSATLVPIQQIRDNPLKFIQNLQKQHPKHLIKALRIMIQGLQSEISKIQQILENQFECDAEQKKQQLNCLSEIQHSQHIDSRQVHGANGECVDVQREGILKKNDLSKGMASTEKGNKGNVSQRKFVIKTPRKPNKMQNYENKRFSQQMKRKGQKPTKINEKNNIIVNQLICKKILESSKKSEQQSIGIKNLVLGVQNGQNKKDYLKLSTSPNRKTVIRFFSKKK